MFPLVLYLPPPLFWGSVLLYMRSPKGGCCSIADDLTCSYGNATFQQASRTAIGMRQETLAIVIAEVLWSIRGYYQVLSWYYSYFMILLKFIQYCRMHLNFHGVNMASKEKLFNITVPELSLTIALNISRACIRSYAEYKFVQSIILSHLEIVDHQYRPKKDNSCSQ